MSADSFSGLSEDEDEGAAGAAGAAGALPPLARPKGEHVDGASGGLHESEHAPPADPPPAALPAGLPPAGLPPAGLPPPPAAADVDAQPAVKMEVSDEPSGFLGGGAAPAAAAGQVAAAEDTASAPAAPHDARRSASDPMSTDADPCGPTALAAAVAMPAAAPAISSAASSAASGGMPPPAAAHELGHPPAEIGESTRNLFRAAAAAAKADPDASVKLSSDRRLARPSSSTPLGEGGPSDGGGCGAMLCALCGEGMVEGSPCGRLLPVGLGAWVHVNCAIWSAEVFEKEFGVLSAVSPRPSL